MRSKEELPTILWYIWTTARQRVQHGQKEKEESEESDAIVLERVKARGYAYHEWKSEHNPQRSALREYVDLLLSIR